MKDSVFILLMLHSVLFLSCHANHDIAFEDEEYTKFIGASNPRHYYERHGLLPNHYYAIDKSHYIDLQFTGKNTIMVCTDKQKRRNNPQIFHISIHFMPFPYMVLDSCIASGNQKLCVGDTIFADEQMKVLWVEGVFLRPFRGSLSDTIRWNPERYDEFMRMMIKEETRRWKSLENKQKHNK